MDRKKRKKRARRGGRTTLWIVCGLVAVLLVLFAALSFASYGDGFDNSVYQADAFAGQRVLVLVPHEDDDIAMAGSTIRLYVDGGAEVYVAFASNGDFETPPDTRVREAIRALDVLGVPKENIVLLGYGDSWDYSLCKHIYHAAGDAPLTSASGRTQTFGANGIADFHSSIYGEPAAYTRDAFLSDLNSLLTILHPDVIFCIDLDSHTDHAGLSWLFEEALGNLIKSNGAYRPKVFKGYAYALNWFGRRDFYHWNLPATYLPEPGLVNDPRFALDNPAYAWEERVRFPVPREALSYTLRSNIVYRALSKHVSQDARDRAEFIISGDTVFFERRTDSLSSLPGAAVSASSGDPACLFDFKLADTDNVLDAPMAFAKGVWRPDAADNTKSVTVTLPRHTDIAYVSLFDDCDPETNILSGKLTFSDGSTFPVGALHPLGQETRVEFPVRSSVTSFTFTIETYEGEAPGLTELLAFAPDEDAKPAFIKLALADESESFLYRYTAKAGGAYPLTVYAYPHCNAEYSISVTEGNGDVAFTDGVLTISPDARPGKHTVTARLNSDPAVFDTVEIVVPSLWERAYHLSLSLYERLIDKIEYHLRWGIRDLLS